MGIISTWGMSRYLWDMQIKMVRIHLINHTIIYETEEEREGHRDRLGGRGRQWERERKKSWLFKVYSENF